MLCLLSNQCVVHRADVSTVQVAHGGYKAAFQCGGGGNPATVRDAAEEQGIKAGGEGNALVLQDGDYAVQVVAVVAFLPVGKILGDVKGKTTGETDVVVIDGSVLSPANCQEDVSVNGGGQHHSTVVVDMLTNNIDTSRSCKELDSFRIRAIHLHKTPFQLLFQGGNILSCKLSQC